MDLSVLPSGPVPPNPQELLTRPLLDRMVAQLANSFDIILIDTPPSSRYAESVSIASRAGGALVVCRQDQTRVHDFNVLCAKLKDANVVIAGTVLNGSKGQVNNANSWLEHVRTQGATAVSRLRLKSLGSNSRAKLPQQHTRPVRTVFPEELEKEDVMTEGAIVLDADSEPVPEDR
jgi:Mrp family chromosome partitioning ATPase